jgi:hypothetical protein
MNFEHSTSNVQLPMEYVGMSVNFLNARGAKDANV